MWWCGDSGLVVWCGGDWRISGKGTCGGVETVALWCGVEETGPGGQRSISTFRLISLKPYTNPQSHNHIQRL